MSSVEHRLVAAIYDGFMWPQELLNRRTVAAIEGEFELERLWRKGILVQGTARARHG